MWDQAHSDAKRRCRGPGGAWVSPTTAAARGNDVMRSPRRASVGSLEAFEATGTAREAPTMREVRKLDSLSAATKGPTTRILRFVLQCVNWGADRLLEAGV